MVLFIGILIHGNIYKLYKSHKMSRIHLLLFDRTRQIFGARIFTCSFVLLLRRLTKGTKNILENTDLLDVTASSSRLNNKESIFQTTSVLLFFFSLFRSSHLVRELHFDENSSDTSIPLA